MIRILKRVWAQVTLALVVGLLLTLFPAEGPTESLHHIGIGLLVAAIVTCFWHMREFSEFFERFSKAVLVDDEYLGRLNIAALAGIRAKAARAILKSSIDNPDYKYLDLGDWIDQILYVSLLPGRAPLSGIYREGYRETILLEYLTLDQAHQEIGNSREGIPSQALQSYILKATSFASFKVFAPKIKSPDYAHYNFTFSGRTSGIPHFPSERRVELTVGCTEEDASSIPISFRDEPKGGLRYDAEPRALPFKDGQCNVWVRTIEYQTLTSQPHILNTMSMLTHNLEINLRRIGSGPKLTFEGDVMATGSEKTRTYFTDGIELRYTGWLFEDNGYFLWWWEKEGSNNV